MQLFKIMGKGELLEISHLEFEENEAYLVDDGEHNTIYIWVGLNVNQGTKDAIARIARKLDSAKSAKILIMKQKREYGSFLSMMHDLKKGLIPGKAIERRPEFVFKTPPKTLESIKPQESSQSQEVNVEKRTREWLQQYKAQENIKPKQNEDKKAEVVKFIPIGTISSVSEDRLDEPEKDQQFDDNEESMGEPDFKIQIQEAAYFLSLKGYSYNDLCWILAEKIQKINLDIPSIEDIKKKAEEVFNSSCTYDELCWLNSEMDILIKKSYLETEKKFQY
ncbi:hypothetical protein LCGC14_1311810 [marine sediment metagenome]|uniref:Gelsolin-like domain-containing protein n=1 Tax=marine sediment metagenome TaxID=412755 RepID=A0A0F9N315_9ZZZZ